MSSEFYLTPAEISQHFLSLGTTGAGLSESGAVTGHWEPSPVRLGPWDAIAECIAELDWVTSLTLSRTQMLALLEVSGLMRKICDFGEVETQIRENLANELSLQLIGEPWPTNGDIRAGLDFTAFVTEFHRRALEAGYALSHGVSGTSLQ